MLYCLNINLKQHTLEYNIVNYSYMYQL